jgi:hypothetical protein
MDWQVLLTEDKLAAAASRPVTIFLHGAAVHLEPQPDGILLRVVPDWAVVEASRPSPAWRPPGSQAG